MPIELSYLSASIALFFVHIGFEAVAANLHHKPKDLLGARDEMPAHSVLIGRAKRSTQNYIEALMMFVPLVLIAALADRFNDLTALGAAIFFWSRVAYAPVYWFGVPVIRSFIWVGGLIGTGLVFFQVLPFSGA